MDKLLHCKLEIEEWDIHFNFSVDDLKQAGVNMKEFDFAIRNRTWCYIHDNIMRTIDTLLNKIMEDYEAQLGEVNWDEWSWIVDYNPFDSSYVEFRYLNISKAPDVFPDFSIKDYFEEDTEDFSDYDDSESDDELAENGFVITKDDTATFNSNGYVLINEKNQDESILVYSLIADSIDGLIELSQQLGNLGIKHTDLYTNSGGEFVLDILDDFSLNERVRITNFFNSEIGASYLGERFSKISRAYAKEHNTYIFKNNAVDRVLRDIA